MGIRRKILVTRETHELLVFTRPGRPERAGCEGCAAVVEMVSLEEAAAASGATALTIYRRADAGELHFAETPEGALLICLLSLAL